MAKKLIRLTEGDLHRIIKESVKNVLNEYDIKNMNGYDIEIVPTFRVLDIQDELFDKYLYNKNGKCLGRLNDLCFIYDVEKNDLI